MPRSALKQAPVTTHLVSRVSYATEHRPNMPTILRVDYWGGRDVVVSERFFPFQAGINRLKAQRWLDIHTRRGIPRQTFARDQEYVHVQRRAEDGYAVALEDWVQCDSYTMRWPHKIVVDRTEEIPRIIEYHFGGEIVPV